MACAMNAVFINNDERRTQRISWGVGVGGRIQLELVVRLTESSESYIGQVNDIYRL